MAAIVLILFTLFTLFVSFNFFAQQESFGSERNYETLKAIKSAVKQKDYAIPQARLRMSWPVWTELRIIFQKDWLQQFVADHKEAGAKKDAQLHYNSEAKAKAAKALADQVK